MKLNLKSGVLGVIILAVAPDAWAQKPGKAQVASTLPIRHGYYADAEGCAAATKYSSGMYFRGRAFEYNDMVSEFVRVSRLPSGEYSVTTRAQGEGGILNRKHKIRIVNPTSFIETYMFDSKLMTFTHRFCYAKPPQGWNW